MTMIAQLEQPAEAGLVTCSGLLVCGRGAVHSVCSWSSKLKWQYEGYKLFCLQQY